MKLSKNQQVFLILGIGGAALAWWWWRRHQGLPLIPNFGGSGGAGFAGSGSTAPTVGGTVRIDNPDVIKARDAQTGALARHSCQAGMRWINTTTAPYYGHCVQNDVFSKWTALPGDVQLYATEATFAQFMQSIGR
jgi:hypothetical protein